MLSMYMAYNRQHMEVQLMMCMQARMEQLLERLGNPQDQFKAVQIAGTKGKGSVAAMVASILRHSQYRVGLYTRYLAFLITGPVVKEDTELQKIVMWIWCSQRRI